MRKAKEAKSVENLYQSAYWHLAKRDMSAWEIEEKLRAKTDNEGWISEVMSHLFEKNHLDDARFVEGFIRYSHAHSRHGPKKIRQSLIQSRGIRDEALIREKFDNTDCDFFELAKSLYLKKFGERTLDFKEKARAFRYLGSRGFEKEHIDYALER